MSFKIEENAFIDSFLSTYRKKTQNINFCIGIAKKAKLEQRKENESITKECLDFLERKGLLKQRKATEGGQIVPSPAQTQKNALSDGNSNVEASEKAVVKIKAFNRGDIERQILGFFIFDGKENRKFVTSVMELFKNDFRSPEANRIANYCINHFKNHGNLPEEKLSYHFANWKASDEQKEAVTKLLQQVKNSQFNVSEMKEMAEHHFTEVRLERLNKSITKSIESKSLGEAVNNTSKFEKFSMDNKLEIFDGLNNPELFKEVMEEEPESLIKFDDALGEFFGNHLCKGSFVTFLAPSKRGKSWWLQECAVQAVRSKKKVLFLSVGDMTKKQQVRRYISSLTRKPQTKKVISIPRNLRFDSNGEATVDFVEKEMEPYTISDYLKASHIEEKKSELRSPIKFSVLPNSTCSINTIEEAFRSLKASNWIPDVLIIDYIDILKFDGAVDAEHLREQINNTWKALRRLSQEKDCLILSATQGNKESYKANILFKEHFSDDRRKNDHVTGIVGINQSPKEKEKGIFRLNWVACREGDIPETKCVYTSSCLGLGIASVESRWKPKQP